MQAGKLGLVEECRLADPAKAEYKVSETRRIGGEDTDIVRMLSVDTSTQATLSTIGNADIYEGAALWDTEKEPERWYPAGDSVKKAEQPVRERTGTRWAAVPATNGHDGFALSSTGAGTFAFTQLGNHQPNCVIRAAHLDLRSFLADKRDELDVWEIGQDDLREQRTGIQWSDGEMSDSEINDAISGKAIITLDASYQDVYRRISLAQSGWIEVFEPEMETAEFLEYISEEILPYAFLADGDADAAVRVIQEDTGAGDIELRDEDQHSLDDLDTVHVHGEPSECSDCGRESDDLQPHAAAPVEGPLCPVCRNKYSEAADGMDATGGVES